MMAAAARRPSLPSRERSPTGRSRSGRRLPGTLLVGEAEERQRLSVRVRLRDLALEPRDVRTGVTDRQPADEAAKCAFLARGAHHGRPGCGRGGVERTPPSSTTDAQVATAAAKTKALVCPRARCLRPPTSLVRARRRHGSVVEPVAAGRRTKAVPSTGAHDKGRGDELWSTASERGTVGIVGLVALLAALAAAVLGHAGFAADHIRADHLDAPGLTPPPGGDGIGTDLTDIYAFRSKTNPNNTVLIMNVNGLASPAGIGNGPGPDQASARRFPRWVGTSR